MTRPSTVNWAPVAAGAGLLGCLTSPDLQWLLESRMSWHMGLQLPLVALAGALSVWPWRRVLQAFAWRINQEGITGFLLVLFVMALWMLPRTLDTVLVHAPMDVAKFVSLWLAGAIGLVSWTAAAPATQAFVVGNAVWMLLVAGLLVQDTTVRLCNAYLLDDQVWAGRSLIAWAVLMSLAWMLRWPVTVRTLSALRGLSPAGWPRRRRARR